MPVEGDGETRAYDGLQSGRLRTDAHSLCLEELSAERWTSVAGAGFVPSEYGYEAMLGRSA